MKLSLHSMVESQLTGSTLANMVKRAKDLGRTHFVQTDLGHLSSTMKTYGLAKKAGLKFIPGIQVYFKDSSCDIVSGTKADRCKYFTVSIYCQDQAAYGALSQIVSRQDFSTLFVQDEMQQLWTWSHLREIAANNVQIVCGGPHCIVGKVMLAGHEDLAQKVLNKLIAIFPDRVSLALVCAPWSKKYSRVIEVTFKDGTKTSLLSTDMVQTNRARRMPAADLANNPSHSELISRSSNMSYEAFNKEIYEASLHVGFLPLPGGDITLRMNEFFMKTGLPLLVSDYAYYANPDDKIVQTMILEGKDKLHPNLHMKSEEEIRQYLTTTLNLSPELSAKIVQNNDEWAKKFDGLELKYEWRLADPGGDALKMIMEIIKEKGRMQWNNPLYVERLQEELKVIAKNPRKDLSAYFLPVRDVLNHYFENGMLTGPGRGSAGGSLLCFLMGITQVNPFKYDLPFNRFFSLDRIMAGELPDIDVDLPDRTLLVGKDGKSGYLYGRWGNKAAQISTRTTMRLKSAIKDTNRYVNESVEEEINRLTAGLPDPPQGVTDSQFIFGYEIDGVDHPGLIETSPDLQRYAASRPKEWDIVQKAVGLTRAFSKHASAFALSDRPISENVPTKEGYITQYEAKQAEAAGLIKYDFLVVKQLLDIQVCLQLINKKDGVKLPTGDFMHQGTKTYIWDLPEDKDVFKSTWGGRTETLFQISTAGMSPYVAQVLPESVMDLANILGLQRPGPLDFVDENTGRNMAEEYVERKNGNSTPAIPLLAELLPETLGVITFQEQLGKIARDLAGFNGREAELLRGHMAKKRMSELEKIKPQFMAGAIKKIDQQTAEVIWEQMVTFGRYGFSVIHAVEYALITYACMFLRHHYRLEWWAAILTNADEKEISEEFWKYVKGMVYPPDINLSTDEMVVDYESQKIRSKLGVIRGMGDATIEPIVANRPYVDIQDFVNKRVAGPSLSHKLIHVGVLDSLFPPRSTLQEKLIAYEQAVENLDFNEKSAKATKEQKKMRLSEPRKGEMPPKYVNLHPMIDAAMKKSTLPSLPLDLHALGKTFSKALISTSATPSVCSSMGHPTILVDGEKLKRLDELDGSRLEKDLYVASTCYVVEAKEFAYPKKNPTKKALKMILDADGYICERVLWANFNSGQLERPEGLKKGVIATVFLKKSAPRKGGQARNEMSIQSILVEAIP
jgi:DNA polymerase III alpha subunit